MNRTVLGVMTIASLLVFSCGDTERSGNHDAAPEASGGDKPPTSTPSDDDPPTPPPPALEGSGLGAYPIEASPRRRAER